MLQFWQERRIEMHHVFQCLPQFSRRQIHNTDATAVWKYKYYAAEQQPDYLVVILTEYGLSLPCMGSAETFIGTLYVELSSLCMKTERSTSNKCGQVDEAETQFIKRTWEQPKTHKHVSLKLGWRGVNFLGE